MYDVTDPEMAQDALESDDAYAEFLMERQMNDQAHMDEYAAPDTRTCATDGCEREALYMTTTTFNGHTYGPTDRCATCNALVYQTVDTLERNGEDATVHATRIPNRYNYMTRTLRPY